MVVAPSPVPQDVQRIYDAWEFYRKAWWRTHYGIGILGVVGSIAVANNLQVLQQPGWLLNAISWLAALCVALVNIPNPKERGPLGVGSGGCQLALGLPSQITRSAVPL